MAEWSKALAWKVSERLIPVPRVQIPSSPPFCIDPDKLFFYIQRRGGRVVEGGRLEIVLAVLSCHVGSNPTLSAIFRIRFLKYGIIQ